MDGVDGGWIDIFGDVYVGRFPGETELDVSNWVKKTLTYEENWLPYLKNVTCAGEDGGWPGSGRWGGGYLDLCIDYHEEYGQRTYGMPRVVYNITKLYERDMEPDWTKQDILDQINSGVNIINHAGHGWVEGAMKMDTSDLPFLQNVGKPLFYFTQACDTGSFDSSTECFAEEWVEQENGAYATIQNTREGFASFNGYDGPSNRYVREYFDAFYSPSEGICQIGRALMDAKENNAWHINESGKFMYLCFYEITLFGDPDASMKLSEPPEISVGIIRPEMALYINNSMILSPLRRALIIGGIDVEVEASSSYPSGVIDRVEFYIDDVLKATDDTEPYSWTWDERIFWRHTIKVIAYSTDGFADEQMEVGIYNFNFS